MVEPAENDAGIPIFNDWDAGLIELEDGGVTSLAEPEPQQGPTAQCLPDLCVEVDCDDGNPCTDDTCDPQRENAAARTQ